MAKIIISRDGERIEEVQLNKERMTIGRHPHNDVVIDHRAVSGEHASITTILHESFLEDLTSTNGTYVNGQRVGKHLLADKDVIVIAKFQVMFVAGPREAVSTITQGQRSMPPTRPMPFADSAPLAAAQVLGMIEIRNGSNAGKTMPLTKALTTLGTPGVVVVVISRRADGYAVAHLEGDTVSTCNGQALTAQPRKLAKGDLIDLAGTQLRFSLA
ncbi:MAG: FHA domain-containing protein [Pseudomonadota bacterium]